MSKIETKKFKVKDPRLGRHVQHDPRSKERPMPLKMLPTVSFRHNRSGLAIDQGNLGMCVGASTAHTLNTGPVRIALMKKKFPVANYAKALEIYKAATRLDIWKGEYPPEDTGTSTLAAMKYLKSQGVISKYTWAFDIVTVIGNLQTSPLIFGTEWTEGMMRPNSKGVIVPSGRVLGGHAYSAIGYEVISKTNLNKNYILFQQSWGNWAVKGIFKMLVSDVTKLLERQGDVCKPIV